MLSSLLPDRETISLVAERRGDRWLGGSSHRLWDVQCVDERNGVIASVLMDADTGQAQQVSGESLPDAARTGSSRSISSSSAISAASAWAHQLGYHGPWRVCEPPVGTNTAWHIKLNTSDRTALLCLDRHSGALVYASITGKYSRYTAVQAAEMSRPMFRELLPEISALSLRAERQQMLTHDGSGRRQWSVICLDAHKNVVARMVRDADTGQIRMLTGELLSQYGRSMKHQPVSLDRAVSAARHWVKRLGYSEEDWHVSNTLPRSNRVWHIQLVASRKTALLTLDKRTDNLIYAAFGTKP